MPDYEYKTDPFDHQRDTFEASRELEAYALFHETGVGKSKTLIDTSAWLYDEGEIDGLLVVAPNGVHRNWVDYELPAHMPDRTRYAAHAWASKKAGTKAHQRAVERLLSHPGLAVLVISYDALATTRGRDYCREFLKRRRCLMAADESKRIKTPSAKRTKLVHGAGKLAAYRRIADGTPITNSPFDVYSQIKFLDPDYWKRLGWGTFSGFKQHFGVWKRTTLGNGRQFNQLLSYRNLEDLEAALEGISSRVRKEDVLDLPPKLYTQRVFELTPAQRRAYEQLRADFITWLDTGEQVTVALAIVRMLRLQQVTCGFVQPDDADEPTDLPDNPRLDTLMDVMEDVDGKAIVWCRFRRDVDNVVRALTAAGRRVVRYDGSTGDDERAEAVARFQGRRPIIENHERIDWEDVPEDEQADVFVANPAAAGEGLTLTAARTVIYYSNGLKLSERLQSEDRAYRIGTKFPVTYVDLIAEDTVDAHIVKSLREKRDIASRILGDEIRDWI